jgi:hypothetical protein
MAAVDVLELNWKLVQNVLQLTRHVLIRMFVGAFYSSYMTRCCALRKELRLLRLLSPSFSVFHFFLSLVVLIAFAGRNDTLRVNFDLRLSVWLRHVQWLL